MLLPDPTSSWLFKPINSRALSEDAMFDEHPSLCELWPKLFFSLTEELSPKACQSQDMRHSDKIWNHMRFDDKGCSILDRCILVLLVFLIFCKYKSLKHLLIKQAYLWLNQLLDSLLQRNQILHCFSSSHHFFYDRS
jgi:hypothetical protein